MERGLQDVCKFAPSAFLVFVIDSGQMLGVSGESVGAEVMLVMLTPTLHIKMSSDNNSSLSMLLDHPHYWPSSHSHMVNPDKPCQ